MPKFIARGEKPKEEIVEFWLESSMAHDGGIVLRAGKGRDAVLLINADGTVTRLLALGGCIPGLQYDDKGRIREVE